MCGITCVVSGSKGSKHKTVEILDSCLRGHALSLCTSHASLSIYYLLAESEPCIHCLHARKLPDSTPKRLCEGGVSDVIALGYAYAYRAGVAEHALASKARHNTLACCNLSRWFRRRLEVSRQRKSCAVLQGVPHEKGQRHNVTAARRREEVRVDEGLLGAVSLVLS